MKLSDGAVLGRLAWRDANSRPKLSPRMACCTEIKSWYKPLQSQFQSEQITKTAQESAMTNDHNKQSDLFDKGMAMRRQVVGDAHVDASMQGANAFMLVAQQAAVELGWGYIWTRPGLDPKTRSLINLGMLTALRASHELKVHVRGAVRNGCTVEEIQEALLQAAVYAGMPAGLEAFRAANEVLVAEKLVPAQETSKQPGGD